MKRSVISIAIAAGLFAVGVAATIDAVVIKRTATVGQKINLSLDGTLNVGGQDLTITGKGVDTVKAVDADGNVTTESSQSDLEINGSPVQANDSTTTTVSKPSGELVSMISAQPDNANGGRFQILISVYYPKDPVNVGDTWKMDLKPDAKLGGVPVKVEMKYSGDEKVGDADTEKLEGSVTETSGDTPASSKSTYWVSKADGSLVKQTSELKDAPLGPTTASGKINLTRTN
ncbi:MAG TPA: hypothetical protein VG944_05635 [Fimbriimonas sp.]|nr:hypothetical protein [Fimbriimonas sp.]